jgi:hypothetical protein
MTSMINGEEWKKPTPMHDMHLIILFIISQLNIPNVTDNKYQIFLTLR